MRAVCPGCGLFLRLGPDTGRCVRCSRTCIDCGHLLRFKTSERCRDCRRRMQAAHRTSICPRCGRLGIIRPESGWCGSCSRSPSPPLVPHPCSVCGELRRKKGEGTCLRCWTRDPGRPLRQTENLIATLGAAPEWLRCFTEFAATRHCVERTCVLLSQLGRLLRDGEPAHPQALLERARQPGRSPGALARTLDEFFVAEHLAFGLDQDALLARGRRQRRIAGVPDVLRAEVAPFGEHLVRCQERARRTGTHPRSNVTIEATLGILRTFAVFLVEERHKMAWAAVQVGDVEAFLRLQPANRARRLGALRQYFRWARQQKIVLVDPAKDLPSPRRRAFRGQTLTPSEQRRAFQRWTSDDGVHPHESFVGIMALLHAASILELRMLRVDDVDERSHTIRLGRRPHPVPLDPASQEALRRCLAHRDALGTTNPHVIVTKATKTRSTPASSPYMTHVLDPAGVRPKTLRSTRIVDLVIGLDPKVAGAALGMQAEGLVSYLADSVDRDRLPGQGRS
jgi:integrase